MHIKAIEHDGLELGALTAGDPANGCLMLLHGWPHCKALYDQVIEELARQHFVIAFDLPDVGDSRGAPRSAEKKELAALLIGAAEEAGARSIVIAGLDVGGMIAYAAARDHGHRICGAAIMNTVIPGIEPWPKIIADPRIWHFAFHAIPALPELLVAGHQRAYFDFFTDLLAGNKAAVSDIYRTAFSRAYARQEALSAGFDWYRAMKADAERNGQYKEIQTPMLYLRGDADGRSPDDYVAGLRSAGARNIVGGVLPNSGEFAPLEAPQALIQALISFASKCQAA